MRRFDSTGIRQSETLSDTRSGGRERIDEARAQLEQVSSHFIVEDKDGAETVNADREAFEKGQTMTLLLAMGVSLVAGLAHRASVKVGGLDGVRLADFIRRWWEESSG